MLLSLSYSSLAQATWESLYIVFLSTLFSVNFGLLLGLLLFYTGPTGPSPKRWLYRPLALATNVFRSVPFIILLFALIPFTRWLLGTAIGNNAVLVPLIIGAIPFYGRIAESAFCEIPASLLETAQAMGSTTWQTICKFLLPEALPGLIKGATLTCIALIGYSAMAGIVGGGGLGELAYDYGYEQNRLDITIVTVVLLIILVQVVQSLGDWLAKTRQLRILALLASLLLIICLGTQLLPALHDPKQTLVVGIMSGPEEKVMKVAQQEAYQKYHLKLIIKAFSDYNIPNSALSSGDLDANIFQHRPFLESQIQKYGYKLTPIAKTFVYPFGFYSQKIKTLFDLKPGATIAIPNDPSNEGRALLLLQKAGLIALKPNSGLFATRYDIILNPKQLHIVTMDSAQIARTLPDVTLAGLTNDFVKIAGFSVKQAIIKEGPDSPYTNLIVTREGDHNPLLKILVAVMHSKAVIQATQQLFPDGAAIPAWKNI